MNIAARKTSPPLVAAAWVVVTIPLGWGVYQSLVKSLPLFQLASPAERPGSAGKERRTGVSSQLRRGSMPPLQG